MRAALFLAALLALASGPGAVRALSWPLCADGGQVWVTERPETEPTFPGANLWFFCEAGLNLLGVSVHDCVANGTLCTAQVPDALCQAFGFDRAVMEDTHIAPARPEEPVRALTGEYCLRQGNYSDVLPDTQALAAMPGEPCRKIEGITCIRTRETIITALDQSLLEAFQPAPPATEPAVPAGAMLTPEQIQQASGAPTDGAVSAASGAVPTDGAGRKLRLRF